MITKIRRGCFETNSSSVHSLTIDKTEAKPRDVYFIDLTSEFGWTFSKYNDPETKATYLYMLFKNNGRDDLAEELIKMLELNNCGSNVLISPDRKNVGYIDHPDGISPEDLQKLYENMFDFVYSKKSILYTGNDNSQMEWEYELEKAEFVITKGN